MRIQAVQNQQTQSRPNFGAFRTNSYKIIEALQKRGVDFCYINDNVITKPQPEMSLKGIVFFTRNDLNFARISSLGEGNLPRQKPSIEGEQKVHPWQNYLALARRCARFISEKEAVDINKKPFDDLIRSLDYDSRYFLQTQTEKLQPAASHVATVK